jgi:Mg-chelatase subunit ChlD
MKCLRSIASAAALFVCAPAFAEPARPRIEVAFALDATGSMGPWIEDARKRIKAIADDLAAGEPRPEVRFALVAYRDRGDAFVTKVHAFTGDVEQMKKALDGTAAEGGGDTPEAVLEALAASLHDLKWTDGDPNVVKLLYLVGDAPPNRHPDSPSEEALVAEALRRGIVLHTIACGGMDGGGQSFFERVARLSEGRPFRLADAHERRRAATTSAAGAAHAGSFAAAVSGSARAYSGSVGVDFSKAAAPIAVEPLAVAAETGLLGAQVRLVADAAAWSDLWSAHVSASPGPIASPPAVDFAARQVLALGGADAGLELVRLETRDGARVAVVKPAAPGVRFVVVPAAETPVIAKGGAL